MPTSTSVEKVIVKKWSQAQSAEAANHHGISPNLLTSEHFESAGIEPEIITIDHANEQIEHNGKTYTIEEWNARGNESGNTDTISSSV